VKHRMTAAKLVVVVLSLAGTAWAQGTHACVYANDNASPANTVDGYFTNGQRARYLKPVATGGAGKSSGTFFASPFIAIAPGSTHLYAADSTSNDIALMSINPASCALTHVANYPSGGQDSFGGLGIVIAPNGKFLYASNSTVATITVLGINADGSLTAPLQTVALPELVVSMAIAPNGKTLITTQSGGTQVMAYAVDSSTGLLTLASGVNTSGAAAGVAIDPHSKFLYIGTGSNEGIEVQIIEIGAGSQLTYIADDFFFQGGTSGNCLLVSPSGKSLYISNQISATVTTLSVNPQSGALSFNSVVADGGFDDEPSELAQTSTGSLVFAGDFNTAGSPKLGIMRASANGGLTSVGTFPLAAHSSPTSVAAGLF